MLPPPSMERTDTSDLAVSQGEQAGDAQANQQQRERPTMTNRQSSTGVSFQTAYSHDADSEESDNDGRARGIKEEGEGEEDEVGGITIAGLELGPIIPPIPADIVDLVGHASTMNVPVPLHTTTTTNSGIPTTPTTRKQTTTTTTTPRLETRVIPLTPSKSISSTITPTPTAADRLIARETQGAGAAGVGAGVGGRVRSGSITIGSIHHRANTGATATTTSPSVRPTDLIHSHANSAAAGSPTTGGGGAGISGRRSSLVEASGAGLKAWWNSFTGGGMGVEEDGSGNGSGDPAVVAAAGGGGGGGIKRVISRPREINPTTNSVFGQKLETSLIYAAVPISTAKHDSSASAAPGTAAGAGAASSSSGGKAVVGAGGAGDGVAAVGGGASAGMYVWGYVPVVVAKCGSHLKETATEVEGTFRVSGSAKRMKDLQAIFDSPPKYGKDLDWGNTQYTTHDVATILRRYLTQMPEPIIPHELYYEFRNVMADPSYTEDEQITIHKDLILKMPKPNQYLLLYVLDMLSVFARRADVNLMTAGNLATIFQPGIIAHPDHEMLPSEHALSQKVLEFLINKQDHFLIGMELEPVRSRSTGVSSYVSPVSPTSPNKHLLSASQGTNATSLAPPAAPVSSGSATHATGRRRGSSINKQAAAASSSSAAAMVKNDSATGNLVGRATPSPVAVQRRPPSPQRADSSIMPASDSDDEAPPGGWYVKTGDPTSLLRERKAAAAAAAARDTRVARSSSLGAGGLVTQLASRRHLKTPGASAMSTSTSAASGAGDALGHPQVTVIENTDIAALPSRSLFRRRTAPTRRNKEDEVMIRKRAERAVRDLGKMSAEAP